MPPTFGQVGERIVREEENRHRSRAVSQSSENDDKRDVHVSDSGPAAGDTLSKQSSAPELLQTNHDSGYAEETNERGVTEKEVQKRIQREREERVQEICSRPVMKRRVRLNISKSHNKVYEWILLEYDAEFFVYRPFEIEFQWKSVSGHASHN